MELKCLSSLTKYYHCITLNDTMALSFLVLFYFFLETTTDDLKPTIDQLIQQVSSLTYQIEELRSIVVKVANCKECLKKQYRSVRDANFHSEDKDNPTVVKMVKRTPSPDQAPAQVRGPAPPDKPNDQISQMTTQPKQTESAQDTTTVLVGSPSRGVYVLKKKMELLPKSTTPKLFALKLFELVFNREEARGGSAEGKGRQLNQLDPNRMAAVKEHTERMFLGEDSFKWVEIKRGIDEKCRMVRNNRCFVWGGVNTMKKD